MFLFKNEMPKLIWLQVLLPSTSPHTINVSLFTLHKTSTVNPSILNCFARLILAGRHRKRIILKKINKFFLITNTIENVLKSVTS